MTLDEFIQKYSGQYVRGGQCGELVRQYWIDVDQTNPPSYFNSKDYWYNPVPGYDKVANPQPGDIAIYDGHGQFVEGHSAIYVGNGQVFEQNADPNGSPAHIFNRANTYLLGYLHKQGSDKEDDMPDEGAVHNAYLKANGRKATPEEVAIYTKIPINNADSLLNGKVFVDLVNFKQAAEATYKPVTKQLYEKSN